MVADGKQMVADGKQMVADGKQMVAENTANPYFIPHHNDPNIASHHFSFIQPCPEGKAATICNLFSILSGRSSKGGGGVDIKKRATVAGKRFGSIFKSPEYAPSATIGVKNTRNALLNNGVVRSIKNRDINPNNVPYIMNEGKLKNYLQLMSWYFMGSMVLNDEQINENITVRPGRATRKSSGNGDALKYSDNLKRESTGITLAVNPAIQRRSYMPKIVKNRRLIANSNNIVLGNFADEYLTNPNDNKVYKGNYGKLIQKKGDDLALAFWLGFR